MGWRKGFGLALLIPIGMFALFCGLGKWFDFVISLQLPIWPAAFLNLAPIWVPATIGAGVALSKQEPR